MSRPLPDWVLAVSVILVLQTTSAFLTRLIPIVFPATAAEFGWDGGVIGYLSAANIVGALFVMMTCIGLIRRVGSIRALQLALLVGAAGVLLFPFPWLALGLAANFLIGFSNGTANPAGSEVLQRYASDANRNFVFSIKQAGVPLGGVIAGLAIPPLVESAGWRAALVIAAAGAVLATSLMWPFQARIDEPADKAPAFASKGFSVSDLWIPLRSLSSAPGLWKISLVGCFLSVAQACWFTFAVTYLVVALGWSLSVAGLVFAVMQATSVFGRVMMGWIADRLGSSRETLAIAAAISAATTGLLGLSGAHWPVWALVLLAAAAGLSVSAWNGVQIAEVARLSPRGLVGETAAGSVILVFLTHMVAPMAFAAIVAATNRFDLAFLAAGAFSLICLPMLYLINPAQKPGGT